MPCVVPLCDGIWHYVVGMDIGPADDGDQPLDRMCDRCRAQRGATPRRTIVREPAATEPEPSSDEAAEAGSLA